MNLGSKVLCALVFIANASQVSLAKDLENPGEWLKFQYVLYSDQADPLRWYSLSLLPTDLMTISYVSSVGEETSFERHVKPGSFASISNLLKEKWPEGTVQEFQCTGGWSHDLRFRLIFSSSGRHVSTAWDNSCLYDGNNDQLKRFSNKLQEVLNTKSIQTELRERRGNVNNG